MTATTRVRGTHAWVDATAGVSGDMVLGALVDAGASLEAVQRAVDAVIPGAVDLAAADVTRAGLRALKLDVRPVAADQPRRGWLQIQAMLDGADLPARTRARAGRVFRRLAEAEAHVHGVDLESVHFHEVGAWDSIADVVGVCAALEAMCVDTMSVSAVALGSGRVTTAHGELPVPTPAVLQLSKGWPVTSGGLNELATPTGMALVTGLAQESGDLPAMSVSAVGVGAGTRDPAGTSNVVRVVIGTLTTAAADDAEESRMWVLETNVDDLDPRVWPSVLSSLLDAGAADAWLVPIFMKKGRPAHTLTVLTGAEHRASLRRLVFHLTSTIGLRETSVERFALARTVLPVSLPGGDVRVKIAHRDGLIVHATAEYDDAAALASDRSVPVRQVLDEAIAAIERAGLLPGTAVPPDR